MSIFCETDRMLLRQLTHDDADELFTLHNDPTVMRFINGGKPTSIDMIRQETLPRFLNCYERYPGLGYWAAIAKATSQFLGWFQLWPTNQHTPDDVELGYRLHVAAWGQGYGTEGSRALITKAFTELGVRRVFATTMTVNIGSRRVMEKSGLSFIRTVHLDWPDTIPGGEHGDVEYELTLADWRRQHLS